MEDMEKSRNEDTGYGSCKWLFHSAINASHDKPRSSKLVKALRHVTRPIDRDQADHGQPT
jgi:hypothetical protein